MPHTHPSEPSAGDIRAAARDLQRQITEELLIEYAEGRLDDDPAARARAEEILAADPEARAFVEDYRLGLTLWPEETAAAGQPAPAIRPGLTLLPSMQPAAEEKKRPDSFTRPFAALGANPALALAAQEVSLPERLVLQPPDMPGFTLTARGSVRRPGEATVLTVCRPVAAGESAPPALRAQWPGAEEVEPRPFREFFGEWIAEMEIPLPWPQAVGLLGSGVLELRTA
ncbi:MAG TPA: hypothetical protein DIT64_16230 [Verrucomicrobiales bacterium]|nr:hypothetical protein [Verrucomicrobiales bacterium]